MPRHERLQPAVVNLNADPVAELARVPGIGRERAEALVMYREQNGPLTNWGELRQVPGFEDEDLIEMVRRETVLG
ncbi:MAG TPA: helix-hairpin-helix domain-containing protein [Thermoanaerobaculia bacterium]|nr:helix-hairpin-helix domain-containing protein [Thermoanaerobaculia bacterium]